MGLLQVSFYRKLMLCAIIIVLVNVYSSQLSVQAMYSVSEPFRAYYAQHAGQRVLGYPLANATESGKYVVQYFEKARLEDHHQEVTDPTWSVMYGRLVVELLAKDLPVPVSATDLTYHDLRLAAAPQKRQAGPPGFKGGTVAVANGTFVPYDAALRPAAGYTIPSYFWEYVNRKDLFPGGWLHDIGLPLTPVLTTTVVKEGTRRTIQLQAFERTALTFDSQNPPDWQVERGNMGTDALRIFGRAQAIEVPTAGAPVTLPIHILARIGNPGDIVTVRLHWHDGTQLTQSFPVIRGEDGGGLLIDNLGWGKQQPPTLPTQAARLEIHNAQGVVLARQDVEVLGTSDPRTQLISLYWINANYEIEAVPQRIVRTPAIATAAVKELLWGPEPNIGWSTAIPRPLTVLNARARRPNWEARVTLLDLTIVNNEARVDLSAELAAYDGGSGAVNAISRQIKQTLKQFPSIHTVQIGTEGYFGPNVLQP
ncbi:MAG: GerMN domain-containing protein [Chloroflexota bacterium]|nr:GerMN domain-containing protein [Chloroflexota bacterium]